VRLPTASGGAIEGDLVVPHGARAVVVFAHGSGSSRHSSRNKQVAEALRRAGFGTLLFDLLTAEEERVDEYTRQYRFDIPRLASRLVDVTDHLRADPETAELGIGYFGASTGAAAALVAAAERPSAVGAIVSRGGRPDLAGDALPRVKAPTLLLVGELDREVIALNRDAMARMRAPTELVIVPGATHLFEEPGALDVVADLAARHFSRYL
jgi:pimeloyl-ACP methyl ester carboxylesterase